MNGNCLNHDGAGRAPLTNTRKMENLQNLHVALWLLKDCSWCELWKWTGMAMVAPTLFVAVWIAWHGRRCLPDLVHNVAVCLWISANVTWMFGEFFYNDGTRNSAKVFFYAGLCVLAAYYLYEFALKFNSKWRFRQAARRSEHA
jgi:hypothetical protein